MEKSQEAAKVYANLSPDAKRKLLSELFDAVYLDGPTLSVLYNRYTEAISKRVKKHHKVIRQFRTAQKSGNNRGEMELTDALRTVWRELVQTLRTSASNYESYEFDNLFDAIEQYEPELVIAKSHLLDLAA